MSFASQAKSIALATAGRTASWLHTAFGDRPGDSFGLLMYHRIVPEPPNISSPTWNVTPGRLRMQLAGLIERGYTPWPLGQVLDYVESSQQIPPRVFVVTLDDGYANNHEHAWPVFKALNVPATMFLATGYIDSSEPFPFDDWSEAGKPSVPATTWRPLTSAQCRELLADDLIEIAAHTHWHEDYTGSPQSFREDSKSCLDFLYESLRITRPALSLPFGEYDEELLHEVRDAGFRCALTTKPTLATGDSTPFEWGRFAVFNHDTPATLAAKLSGWYGPLATAWHRRPQLRVSSGALSPVVVAKCDDTQDPVHRVPLPVDPHIVA